MDIDKVRKRLQSAKGTISGFDGALDESLNGGRVSLRLVVLIVDLLCLMIHIVFTLIFIHMGISEMVGFNIGSVLFYLTLALFICKTKNYTVIVSLGLLEIVFHAIAATVYAGWNCGFAMFIVCIAPIPFFLRFRKKWLMYLMSAAMVAVFICLKIYTAGDRHVVYLQRDIFMTTSLYLFNSVFSFVMLIGFSAFFRINREITQRRLTEQNESLSKLAAIDPLTGLFNRRAMTDYLRSIHDNSERTGEKYVIAMCDIDNFKMINDTYGHQAGDTALVRISQLIMRQVPTEGYVCRWGGEEILFIVPSCDCETGTRIAETIRGEVEALSFDAENESFGVTLTFGVSESRQGISYEKIISAADDCLYYGKENGKNMVVNESIIIGGRN